MTMDRLPLVQALTPAGLERHGAEQVATALGEAIEASVATKSDVTRLESSISRLELSTRADLQALENRMTLRLGGIVAASAGALFALHRSTGHSP